jgi:transcriptional repressor NrdR
MQCPRCGHQDDKVLDSRAAHEGKSIRRRRECLECGFRFTTFEEILKDELVVVKRNGHKEDFSRQKLTAGIRRAFLKRTVTDEQIEKIVDSVIDEIQRSDKTDIPSSRIGEIPKRAILAIDQVAYVRFASVYLGFENVAQFKQIIDEMAGADA